MIYFIILLLLLGLAHWAGDFTHMSTKWMLDAKAKGLQLLPILAHAYVHSFLVFVAVVAPGYGWWIGLLAAFVQLVTHFFIDLLKGRMNVWFPKLADPANKFHWYVFGGDQYLHFIVIVLTAWMVFEMGRAHL